MKYYLMHKNIEVAILDIDNQSNLNNILKVMRYDHMPYGSLQKNNIVDRRGLQRWWWSRSIPVSRQGLDILLETLSIPTPSILIEKCLGLSLTDQYWVKPIDTSITWENVNFFTNPFSDDIGNILFGESLDKDSIMFNSPDITSGGNLLKKWKIINGERCLIKGGSKPDLQEPLNELIATKVADILDLPHVEYSLIWNDGNPYSVCPDFINENTELVTANSIRLTQSDM